MIYVGDKELTVMLGDMEIPAIYCGDLQIYPTDFGTLTGITIEDLVWVTDVGAGGGTATSANCSFNVYAQYDSGKRKRVTKDATVTGSLVVPATSADTREMVGTLTLTASYEGFTDSDSVDAYQKAQTYNNIIIYTTTDNQQLVLPSTTWDSNIVSHTFTNNTGRIVFEDDLTAIADDAFSGCTTLETVSIPDTVTSYGARAFKNCSNMTEFHIKSGITSIGQECFYETSGDLTIESAYAASGVSQGDSYIYGFAGKFCGDTTTATHMNFDKVIITGDTITNIPSCAFHSSPATEYIIGDNVRSCGYMAFARMNAGDTTAKRQSVLNHKPLMKLTIGSGMTSLGTFWLFYGVNRLNEINYYPPTYNGSVTSSWFEDYQGGTAKNGTIHYKASNTGRLNGLPSGWSSVYDL